MAGQHHLEEDEEMKKKVWCKHIHQHPLAHKRWWMFRYAERSYIHVEKDWKVCPICLVKRPK